MYVYKLNFMDRHYLSFVLFKTFKSRFCYKFNELFLAYFYN